MNMDNAAISTALALTAACIGAYGDWKTHKIPNRLTMPAMLIGLAVNLILGGLKGLGDSALGIAAGFSFFLLFAMGALKAGDVKLYMAIGALGGWRMGVNTMCWSVLIGGILAFVTMFFRKSGRKGLKAVWTYLTNMITIRRFYRYQAEEETSYICFGGCIAAGAFAAMLYGFF